MQSTTTGQRFRCRFVHWHPWKPTSTPDGERYVACAVCGKDHSARAGVDQNITGYFAG
ncbi:hypothetical protein ACI797_21095 [Geodermatophilus sp. SYSU D00691]